MNEDCVDLQFQAARFLFCDSELLKYMYQALNHKNKKYFIDFHDDTNFLRNFLGNLFYNWRAYQENYRLIISLRSGDYTKYKYWNNVTQVSYRVI